MTYTPKSQRHRRTGEFDLYQADLRRSILQSELKRLTEIVKDEETGATVYQLVAKELDRTPGNKMLPVSIATRLREIAEVERHHAIDIQRMVDDIKKDLAHYPWKEE